MSAVVNKALVRRFIQAQNEKDLAVLEEIMAPDFVDHSILPGQGTTREDYLQDVAEHQAASSEARLIIEDQMAEDDKVISRLTKRGSHDQEMFTGVPPTGVKLEFTGIIFNRVVGGKIAEEWSEGTYAYELTQQRLDQELRERERFEAGATGGAAYPAGLAPQGAAPARELGHRPLLPTRPGGRRRLLRLSPLI